MSIEIIVAGDDVTLETTETVFEVLTEGVQGPAGPPGPVDTSNFATNEDLANRVRFDSTQTLTEPQQDQARSNINAEKVGVAATLVAAVTTSSIGAATAVQGAKADTAIQSGDLAPVALSGSFSDLINKSAVFNLVYSAYVIGSNVGILATDTLGEMLGKLQAQVNAKLDANANAVSATKLVTARNINGVAFDGTANITIADSTKEPAIAVDLVTKFWSGTKTFRDLATDVRAVVLTGLSTATATAVVATDSILVGIGKLQAQVTANGTSIATKANLRMTTNAQTGTTYTFVLGDANNQTTTNNAAANTFTIPPVASVAWTVNDVIFWRQLGVGQTTFVGGSGVTFRNPHGTLKSLGKYKSGAFVYAGSDVWDVTGDLAEF